MSDELVETLRELADYDARSGEPLGRCMRTAADVIEELIAERDALSAACAEWAEVSQSNYQRAKAAEANLAQRDAALKAADELDRAVYRTGYIVDGDGKTKLTEPDAMISIRAAIASYRKARGQDA